jgi:hypothetical protein
MEFNLKSNYEEVDAYFKRLGYYFPELARTVLRTITNEMKKAVKKNNTYRKRTGSFESSIYSKVVINKLWAKVGIRYKSGRKEAENLIKANVSSVGANIYPKNETGKLVFKINDSWVRTKKVEVRPRPFFEKSYESVLNRVNEIIIGIANKLMSKVNK